MYLNIFSAVSQTAITPEKLKQEAGL